VSRTASSLAIRRWFSAYPTAQWLFVLFTLPFSLCSTVGRAQESTFDRESYYRAVEYCRHQAWPGRSMHLSPDKQVLCFDGRIAEDLDASLASDLREDGLFVVRSSGGNSGPAIALSNIVRDRHATVVVYDYCFSACASFFLIASHQTYVLKGSLVVWHNPVSGDPNFPFCTFLTAPRDGGLKKLQRGPCGNRSFEDETAYRANWPILTQFFKERTVDPLFEFPPDSRYVRKIVTGFYKEMGVYRDIGWTLNPRYYPRWFKTNISYEAYPDSQEEVDGMVARLGVKWKVIYDP
jgi:hypothetical protein